MTPDQITLIQHFTELSRASWFRTHRFLKGVFPQLTQSMYLNILRGK